MNALTMQLFVDLTASVSTHMGLTPVGVILGTLLTFEEPPLVQVISPINLGCTIFWKQDRNLRNIYLSFENEKMVETLQKQKTCLF